MWEYYNANPAGLRVGDCVIRALTKALDSEWDPVYVGVTLEGFLLHDMPSANHVWGAYLRRHGFTRQLADGQTVSEFAAEHPRGVYVLALSGHVVCVSNGDWHDSWDSGGEEALYFWERK